MFKDNAQELAALNDAIANYYGVAGNEQDFASVDDYADALRDALQDLKAATREFRAVATTSDSDQGDLEQANRILADYV